MQCGRVTFFQTESISECHRCHLLGGYQLGLCRDPNRDRQRHCGSFSVEIPTSATSIVSFALRSDIINGGLVLPNAALRPPHRTATPLLPFSIFTTRHGPLLNKLLQDGPDCPITGVSKRPIKPFRAFLAGHIFILAKGTRFGPGSWLPPLYDVRSIQRA